MQIKQSVTQFGLHLMVDGYGADPAKLTDEDRLVRMLQDVPESMGMHIICDPVVVSVGPKNRKDPGGLSGFVMIAESHISFHTFPSRGFVTVDAYTCQNEMDTTKLVAFFTEAFSISWSDVYVQRRGLHYPTEDLH